MVSLLEQGLSSSCTMRLCRFSFYSPPGQNNQNPSNGDKVKGSNSFLFHFKSEAYSYEKGRRLVWLFASIKYIWPMKNALHYQKCLRSSMAPPISHWRQWMQELAFSLLLYTFYYHLFFNCASTSQRTVLCSHRNSTYLSRPQGETIITPLFSATQASGYDYFEKVWQSKATISGFWHCDSSVSPDYIGFTTAG